MTAPRTSDVRWLLKDALGVVFKRQRLILVLFLLVAVGITITVASIPDTYEVAGKVVVTRERGDVLMTPADLRNFNFSVTAPTIQDMAVHADLLKNRSLVEAVAKRLGLDRKKQDIQAAAAGAPPPAPNQELLNASVDSILYGLNIQVVPNSNLIYVRYRSSNPVKGSEIVNTLLDLYKDTYLQVRGVTGASAFFDEQLAKMTDAVKKADQKLAAFEAKSAFLAPAVQVDAYSRRLAEADNNATDARFDLREAEQRAEYLKQLIEQQPERLQTTSTIQRNPMIETMKQQLLQLQIDKQHLLTLYQPDSRLVQDKQAEIDAQEKRLEATEAQQWVPNSEVSQMNDYKRDLEDMYLNARLAVQKNTVRYEGADAISKELHTRVKELGEQDVERTALEREVQAGTDDYLLYRKKAEEARVGAALDESKITNVAIGELASPVGTPVGPPKSLSYVFAVMVGVVSGVGGAFLREFFDDSIKTEEEMRSVIDLPLLGSISDTPNGKAGRDNGAHGTNGTPGKNGIEG